MKTVLAIETSCDETGVAFVRYDEHQTTNTSLYTSPAHALHSQIDTHAPYGGVFPMLAKREHGHNLVGLLASVIHKTENSGEISYTQLLYTHEKIEQALQHLERETELLEICRHELTGSGNTKSILLKKPQIDALVVTAGPGLEPALWVGISFVKFLSTLWDISVLPVNHMEGHIASVLLQSSQKVIFPALGLLISGGHTELVSISDWGSYAVIGKTRDDAIGEAYDKVARILGLPYPGGPAISVHAEHIRNTYNTEHVEKLLAIHAIKLPRPMMHSKNLEFSFSGLKTAVLYLVRELKVKHNLEKESSLPQEVLQLICYEFEEAVTDVVRSKLDMAYEEHRSIQTLIVAGGVIANTYIRETIETWCKTHDVMSFLPKSELATDNAVMIGLAGIQGLLSKRQTILDLSTLTARGGWKIDEVY